MKMLIIGVLIFMMAIVGKSEERYAKATFAGGCFWCMQPAFESLDGVVDVVSGYTGGVKENPSYEEVSTGETGHIEAVQVIYDPARISYKAILEEFWKNIDPTDEGGQFSDRGTQYMTAVFYNNDREMFEAKMSIEELAASGKYDRPIATMVLPAKPFYPAEEYHQEYSKKNPVHYERYKEGSGRDSYIKRMWGDKRSTDRDNITSEEDLRTRLTPLQYKVTQEEGTEEPFENDYWNNNKEGIYVDLISGEPLFSSTDKFSSGTGWPSFTRPIDAENIVEKEDRKLSITRIEVRSRSADSHLGHIFSDGPEPTGLRYCVNSAALRFIPKEDMEKEGYGEYLVLFD